jgi:hypothetical protein
MNHICSAPPEDREHLFVCPAAAENPMYHNDTPAGQTENFVTDHPHREGKFLLSIKRSIQPVDPLSPTTDMPARIKKVRTTF